MASRIVVVFCFFFASLLCFLPPTMSRDYLGAVYHNCLRNATTTSISSAYLRSLGWALRKLLHLSSSGTVYNITSVGSGTDKAYAMFQCRGDQSWQGCYDCVYNVTRTLPVLCPSSIGARFQADGCYLRYDDKTFFTPDFDFVVGFCYGKTSDPVALSTIESLMQNVTTLAPANDGYAAESAEGLYALAQCLGYLNESECSHCLKRVSWRLTCDSALGEQYHSASCYYRYESYTFYTPAPPSPSRTPTSLRPFRTSPASPTPGSSTHKIEGWKLVIVIVGAVVGVFFAVVALHRTLMGRHKPKPRQDRVARNDPWSQQLLQPKAELFSLHELEVATRDFHPDNKLGEGVFGPVYKGTLQNGLNVAVKMLSSRSKQGMREFINEVNLITSVQHRNLIKLLGSCVEGSHRILVYEYLPNKSLREQLFGDSPDAKALDWHTRIGIILGMARGLVYLHEDSQFRIAHRDIKPSNVLLDEQLNPVITDFGLARLVTDEESHIVTRVAGTLGYLAPEYAARGQFTEKVDVFSFGVVTLEIVTGRQNLSSRLSTEEDERLLDWTWRVYQEHRQLELVDPKLGSAFIAEEVIRVVHVALLCTQEVPMLRPSMSTVTLMLSRRSDKLEIPTKPAFAPQDSTGHSWSITNSDLSRNLISNNAAFSSISNNAAFISEVEPR